MTTSCNTGIGTTSPINPLHVRKTNAVVDSTDNVITVEKRLSAGTAAAGIGSAIRFFQRITTQALRLL